MTSTETKPASKRGRKSKDELAELPPLDLSSLAVETVTEMPKQRRQVANNPFVQHLKDSYEYENARVVTVDTANVGRVESMIRRAADVLEIGVSVHKAPADGDDSKTVITFAGKERRTRKSGDDETSGEGGE